MALGTSLDDGDDDIICDFRLFCLRSNGGVAEVDAWSDAPLLVVAISLYHVLYRRLFGRRVEAGYCHHCLDMSRRRRPRQKVLTEGCSGDGSNFARHQRPPLKRYGTLEHDVKRDFVCLGVGGTRGGGDLNRRWGVGQKVR